MFTRIVTFTGATDIDAGIDYTRETVAPLLRQQKGFRGTTASADRSAGTYSVMSTWESEADRDASESAMAKVREEAQHILGGEVSVEQFEQVLIDANGPPPVGSSLLIRRVSMDPAKVDDNLEFFEREVLPQIKANNGLLVVRQMVNRQTGEAIVGTVWADRASMQAAAADAQQRQGVAAGRVTFGEQSQRELVFIDMP
jgi:heme-degrading monooxygenase HmoA